MEFLADYVTNIREAARIHEVYWLRLVASRSSPGTGAGSREGLPGAFLGLLSVECQLLDNGYFVCADLAQDSIWIFNFADPGTDWAKQLAHSVGLTVDSQGLLTAGELVQQGQQLHPQSSGGLAGNPAYARFMMAISRSLSYALSTGPFWLPLGPHTCVNLDSLDVSSYCHPWGSEAITFLPRWHCSGSVTVQVVTIHTPKIMLMSNLAETENLTIDVGSNVMLLPSGLTGGFRGFLNKEGLLSEWPRYAERKRFVEDYLRQGFGFSSDIKVWVRIKIPTRESEADAHSSSDEFIWPADLCLFHSPEELLAPGAEEGNEEFALDPIARAQIWYREHVNHENEEEADKKHVKQEQAKPNTNNITDANMVYPTPSDGLPTTAHETPAESGNLETTLQNSTNEPDAADEAEYNFRPSRDDEIYDEPNMGITEADFEFFDTPDQESPALEQTNHASQDHEDGPEASQSSRNKMPSHANDTDLPISPRLTPPHEKTSSNAPALDAMEDIEVDPSDHEDKQRIVHSTIKESGPDVDEKYKKSGRFGFDVDKVTDLKPLLAARKVLPPAMPQIGMLEGSTSDSESDDSDHSSTCSSNHSDKRQQRLNMLKLSEAFMIGFNLNTQNSTLFNTLRSTRNLLDSYLGRTRRPLSFFDDAQNPAIQVAQFLIDQAITFPEQRGAMRRTSRKMISAAIHNDLVTDTLAERLPHCRTCNLRDLDDKRVSQQSNRVLTTSSPGSTDDANRTLIRLPSPFMRVSRGESISEVHPSGLSSWEIQGFEPLFGQKDVLALSMGNLDDAARRDCVVEFMRNMRDAYQTCGLGVHDNILDEDRRFYDVYRESYRRFGHELASVSRPDRAVVVYLIDDTPASTAKPQLGEASLEILAGFRVGVETLQKEVAADLVIQFVPLSFMFSSWRIVTALLEEYQALAFELYSRCNIDSADELGEAFLSEPAISLAPRTPKAKAFQLTTDPNTVSMHRDINLHVAYMWHEDSPWLTASWTDNIGVLQWSAAYWVGFTHAEGSWVAFTESLKEILATTLEMLDSKMLPWNIYIAKCGRVMPEELQAWQEVISNASMGHFNLIFVSIEAHKSLELYKPPKLEPVPAEPVNPLATPVATPDPGVASPETPANAATPGAFNEPEQDPETTPDQYEQCCLLRTDQAGEDPNISPGPCHSQASGFLLRKVPTTSGEQIHPLSMSIVHGARSLGHDTSELVELAGMYNDLAVLARLRQVTDPLKGVLPLHVAAAYKAHAALENVLIAPD